MEELQEAVAEVAVLHAEQSALFGEAPAAPANEDYLIPGAPASIAWKQFGALLPGLEAPPPP